MVLHHDGFIIAVKAYNLSRVAAKIGGIALL
jgi:hypothetical protein